MRSEYCNGTEQRPAVYLHFNGHFPRWIWVSRYQNVSILDFIGAKDDGGGGENWKESSHRHQQTNTQFLYRPDALPVAQPTVSEH